MFPHSWFRWARMQFRCLDVSTALCSTHTKFECSTILGIKFRHFSTQTFVKSLQLRFLDNLWETFCSKQRQFKMLNLLAYISLLLFKKKSESKYFILSWTENIYMLMFPYRGGQKNEHKIKQIEYPLFLMCNQIRTRYLLTPLEKIVCFSFTKFNLPLKKVEVVNTWMDCKRSLRHIMIYTCMNNN